MTTRVKICGLTRPEDAAAAAELGVQTIACVFSARSARYVTTGQAWAIRRVLPPAVRVVGVFVDTPAPLVQRIVDQCQLDAAQFFGAEPRSEVDSVTPFAFKAVTVRGAADVEAALKTFGRRSKDPAWPTMLLHLADAAKDRWDLVSAAAARQPVLVASESLTARNLPGALRTVSPWGIDLWESVESAPGVLDARKLAEAVAAVREWDRQGVRRAAVDA